MLRAFKGKRPVIAASAYVDPSAVVIGDVEVDDDASIWPLVAIRGDVCHIRIGARTNIQDGSVLHVASPGDVHREGIGLVIGEDVTVGHRCILHACTIHDRVLVGMGAVVLDGAILESEVVVAANSLVAPGKKLESGYLYMGSPAEKKRLLTESERRQFVKSAAHYVATQLQYQHEEASSQTIPGDSHEVQLEA